MKTITNVNSYVAWAEFQGSRSAYAQGIAESEEEFRQMCEEKGIDLTDCIVELNKKNRVSSSVFQFLVSKTM